MTNEFGKNVHTVIPARCEIYFADLKDADGNIQGGIRPVIVVGNDIGNKYSPIAMVVPVTSKNKKHMPTHVYIGTEDTGLKYKSIALTEQAMPISKERLRDKVGKLNESYMSKVDFALSVTFGLVNSIAKS